MLKLIYEPTVYVVGRTLANFSCTQDFLKGHGAESWEKEMLTDSGEYLCEMAGRLCYMSFTNPRPGGNTAYLDHIKEVGHGSVLEHTVWNFIITGISRSCSHELVRHRAGWSYSQLSQRYVDESNTAYIVPHDLQYEVGGALAFAEKRQSMPTSYGDQVLIALQGMTEWRELTMPQVDAGLHWLNVIEEAQKGYRQLVEYIQEKWTAPRGERGCFACGETADHFGYCRTCEKVTIPELKTAARKFARQAARSVLPNATETKIFCTANARAIRHFLELRCSPAAEPEIRKVAYQLWTILVKEAPNLFNDYAPCLLPDDTYELTTPYRKV